MLMVVPAPRSRSLSWTPKGHLRWRNFSQETHELFEAHMLRDSQGSTDACRASPERLIQLSSRCCSEAAEAPTRWQ